MDEWIDYYDSTHTIYASKLHRDLHFQIIARDIIGYISSPDAIVLDYACGEALSAAKVADVCGKLYLAEPAPGVRGGLIARSARTRVGLQRYGEDEMIEKLAAAGFAASRAHLNIGHNPWRMTFVARHAFQRT